MRHRIAGRILNRTSSHRKAMRRNMAISLIQHGAIRTTEAKAKEIRPFVEKLITMARKNTLHARRLVSSELGNIRASKNRPSGSKTERGLMFDNEGAVMESTVLDKLFGEIAPRYVDRPGGYTRIVRIAERRLGDAGKQVILQLIEEGAGDTGPVAAGGTSRRRRRAAKRHEALAETAEGSPAEAAVAEASAEALESAEQAEAEGAEADASSSEQTDAAGAPDPDAEDEKPEA